MTRSSRSSCTRSSIRFAVWIAEMEARRGLGCGYFLTPLRGLKSTLTLGVAEKARQARPARGVSFSDPHVTGSASPLIDGCQVTHFRIGLAFVKESLPSLKSGQIWRGLGGRHFAKCDFSACLKLVQARRCQISGQG
jgi:hypothetical protein